VKATEAKLLDFLKKSPKFVIPIYGEVEVGLSKPEELPYVMGLVRQAFEKQMGNGEAEV
jgi:predicted transport protein